MDAVLILCYIILYLLFFLLGACIASFLNVVACRLPQGESFVKGRSHCPACGATLSAGEMLPVLGWLLLRGRCKHCGAPISARYPITEAVGGLLFALDYAVFGLTPLAGAVAVFFSLLLLLSLIDIDTMTLPDGLTLLLLLPAAALVFLLPGVTLLEHLIGAVCVSLFLLLLTLLIPESFGGGDIKLFAVCGLALGWKLILFAFLAALLSGALWGLLLLSRKKLGRKDHMVFGPFIAFGAVLALLAGTPLIHWYLGLF